MGQYCERIYQISKIQTFRLFYWEKSRKRNKIKQVFSPFYKVSGKNFEKKEISSKKVVEKVYFYKISMVK